MAHTVTDDGAGLDFKRIREKAVATGLIAADVELPEAQLAQFIFASGFSTATEVSQVSGRGVGLDVVRNEITALGGRVEIVSTPGRGTSFTITLPLTLAVTQAVMLRAGSTIYAVPSVMIEQVQEYKAPAYAEVAARAEIAWKEHGYPLLSLHALLGEMDSPVPARQIPVLLLKSGLQRAAIRVDELIGNREVDGVASAKEGVDALQQLQDLEPDCILLDVEMPRMDGFEFARNVRADEGTRDIPIIMITSRTADKHRNHALELGVNEYMGKPYQEDQLLALIRRYTKEAAVA